MSNSEDPRFDLTRKLMPKLLAGPDPRLVALRRQWQVVNMVIESETNWGFFARFSIGQSVAAVEPPNFCGGDAVIHVSGLRVPAGCMLYVERGYLSYLEVYTHDEPWEHPPKFLSVAEVVPIIPGEHLPAHDG